MKRILARIVSNTLDGFEFASPQDEKNFREVIHWPFDYSYDVGGRTFYKNYEAWATLRRLGWFSAKGVTINGEYYVHHVLPETDEERLELCLDSHDWFYHMSDDNRYYQSGKREWEIIKDLMAKVGEPKATELLNKYKQREGILED